MTGILIIFIAAASAFSIYWFLIRNRDYVWIWKGLDQELGIPKHKAKFKYRQVTPKGCPVISVVKLPDFALRNLEIGIENRQAQQKAVFPSWDKKIDFKEINFVIVDRTLTNQENEPGSPAINAMNLQTAGSSIGLGPSPASKRPYIVMPHQADCDWRFRDYFMRTAWHEYEHYVERFNSMEEFYRYAISGDVHPHIYSPDIPEIPAV